MTTKEEAAAEAADAPNAPTAKEQKAAAANFEAAQEQAAKDAEARTKDPGSPVHRAADARFGGESFGYGGPPA